MKIVTDIDRRGIIVGDQRPPILHLLRILPNYLIRVSVLTWTRQTIKTPNSAGTSIPFIFLPSLTFFFLNSRTTSVWCPPDCDP